MRTAVYYSNQDIKIKDMPRPKISKNELLLRVEAAGICGSDIMEWYRRDKVPLVLGHEISGTVEEAGAQLKDYKKGDRLVCAHHVPCGKCNYCLSGHETVCETLRSTNFDPGGFSEFVRLPAINVEKGVFFLPDSVSFEEATFVEPLACVLRGQRQAGGVKGKRILIIGSGIAGILHILLAKYFSASFIAAVDILEYRLKTAKAFGADVVIAADKNSLDLAQQLNKGRLFDLVIVSTGASLAITQALESVDRGGTVLFFAPTDKGVKIPLSFNEIFWRREVTLTSSYAGSPSDYKDALDLLAAGKLNVRGMITHRLGLSEIASGFGLVLEAKDSLKVIIYPQN